MDSGFGPAGRPGMIKERRAGPGTATACGRRAPTYAEDSQMDVQTSGHPTHLRNCCAAL